MYPASPRLRLKVFSVVVATALLVSLSYILYLDLVYSSRSHLLPSVAFREAVLDMASLISNTLICIGASSALGSVSVWFGVRRGWASVVAQLTLVPMLLLLSIDAPWNFPTLRQYFRPDGWIIFCPFDPAPPVAVMSAFFLSFIFIRRRVPSWPAA